MSQVILWFWRLIFFWSLIQFGTPKFLFGAQEETVIARTGGKAAGTKQSTARHREPRQGRGDLKASRLLRPFRRKGRLKESRLVLTPAASGLRSSPPDS